MYRGRTILHRVLNDKWPSVDWLMSRLDWLIRLRSVGFSSEGLVRYRKVTLAGVAVVSSLRALIIQTYRVPSISVLHRGRGCELRDDVGGSKSPGMHYSQFHIEIARGGTPLPARGNGNAFYLSPRRQPVKAAPRDRRPCFHLQIYLTFRRSLPKSLGERTNTEFDSRRIKYKSS